jgi:outer membrane protein TolC
VLSHHVVAADAVLSQPLFTGGRLSANLAAAERAREAASRSLGRTKTEIVFSVSALYYALLAQRQLSSALAGSEAALLEQVGRLEALVRERKAAPLDRQRVEVRLAAVKQRRIQEENLQDIQLLSLSSLLGIGAGASLEVEGTLGRPEPVSAIAAEALVVRAFQRREDYLAALASVRAQQARRNAARAGHWPQISLQGSYGVRWCIAPSVEPASVSALADVGQVGLLVDVPIFLGGRVNADVREQEARLAAALERWRKLELRIRQEVGAALADVRSSSARFDLAERAQSQATEAYRVETLKYEAGKSTVSDVLLAQADVLDAEANLARALADANTAVAELALATGDTP